MSTWSVPSSLASRCRTKAAALNAAAAVYEARIIAAIELGIDSSTDIKLYELERAYHRRADELAKKPKKKRKPTPRAGKGRK